MPERIEAWAGARLVRWVDGVTQYTGATTTPAGTAAAAGGAGSPTMWTPIAANTVGQDGEMWTVVN